MKTASKPSASARCDHATTSRGVAGGGAGAGRRGGGGGRAPRPPLLAHAEEVAAEVALQVVVEGPLAAVGEHDAHEAGAALEDRGHLLDHGALAPLLVIRVEDAVAEAEVETRRHRPSVAGPARPLPARTMPTGGGRCLEPNPGDSIPPFFSPRSPIGRWGT